jgi:3-deoxy-7-phosphoheptulonate synthase
MGMTKMGVAAIFETRGNDDCHVILRGGKVPNHDAAGVETSCAALEAVGLRPQVMVDVSHGNSGKRAERQVTIAAELAGRIAAGERRIFGLMIESHLEAGRQDFVAGVPLRRGVSITDACIGFDETVPVLRGLAAAVEARRQCGA